MARTKRPKATAIRNQTANNSIRSSEGLLLSAQSPRGTNTEMLLTESKCVTAVTALCDKAAIPSPKHQLCSF